MKTYLVYHQKTGEVVRSHIASETHPIAREHLLAMIQSEHRNAPLDVLEVNDLSIGECCRVDVQTKTVRRIGQREVKGFGMFGGQLLGKLPAAKAKKTTYRPAPPKQQKQ
jgi:hypothetical protein